MDISDATLLRKWQRSSDSEAFATIVARHSAMVFTTCNRILRNSADAEDVTQECFMELGGVRTLYGNSLGGLLHTLATHRSLDRIKRESRRREREIRYAMGRPASYTVRWDDVYPHIDEAIANLPIKYRDSLIRHYLEGQTHAEIACAAGIADATVRYRINKGIERVRTDLHRRGVIVSTASMGAMFGENIPDTVSASLSASLGKLSVAGAGNAPSTPRTTVFTGRTLAATKAVGIIVIVALAGFIAWTLRTATAPVESPTGQVISLAPVETPDTRNTMPAKEQIALVEPPHEPITPPTPAPIVEVPSVAPPVIDESASEDDPVTLVEQAPEPMPEPATEVATSMPPVGSPKPQDSVAKDDVVALVDPPQKPTPAPVLTEKAPSVERPVAEMPRAETAPPTPVAPPDESTPEDEPFTVATVMEPLSFELPEAFFGGTPIDYWGPNLEAEDYKDRPPFLAPSGTTVISTHKPVTASSEPTVGALVQLTDGDKDYAKTSLIELPEGLQWVQIDLEKTSLIYAVLVWHFHEGKRVYFDLVAQVSDDPEFNTGVTTIYNNDYDNSAGLGVGEDKEYIESNKGRLIDAKGARGRYLRVYGKGSTASDFNHFIEVEVWGKQSPSR
jgi:RNA polymerase sigma factor (sigma-70 family)